MLVTITTKEWEALNEQVRNLRWELDKEKCVKLKIRDLLWEALNLTEALTSGQSPHSTSVDTRSQIITKCNNIHIMHLDEKIRDTEASFRETFAHKIGELSHSKQLSSEQHESQSGMSYLELESHDSSAEWVQYPGLPEPSRMSNVEPNSYDSSLGSVPANHLPDRDDASVVLIAQEINHPSSASPRERNSPRLDSPVSRSGRRINFRMLDLTPNI